MDTSKEAAALGRKGGKAGTGEAKRRGDSAYYKALRAKRAKPLSRYADLTVEEYIISFGREALPDITTGKWLVESWEQDCRGWGINPSYATYEKAVLKAAARVRLNELADETKAMAED